MSFFRHYQGEIIIWWIWSFIKTLFICGRIWKILGWKFMFPAFSLYISCGARFKFWVVKKMTELQAGETLIWNMTFCFSGKLLSSGWKKRKYNLLEKFFLILQVEREAIVIFGVVVFGCFKEIIPLRQATK